MGDPPSAYKVQTAQLELVSSELIMVTMEGMNKRVVNLLTLKWYNDYVKIEEYYSYNVFEKGIVTVEQVTFPATRIIIPDCDSIYN